MSQEQGGYTVKEVGCVLSVGTVVCALCIMEEASRASGLLSRKKNYANAACGLAEGRENPH